MGARGPLVIRRRLGAKLKTLRESANVRLDTASSRIECSTSKLSRLEHGQGIPRAIEVAALLDLYGVADQRTRDRILSWTERAKATTWWQPYSDAIADDLELYISLEAEAQAIRTFSNGPLHGLLQTRNYAEATIEPYASGDRRKLSALVEVRLRRRSVIDRTEPEPVRLDLILAEEALFRRMGSTDVMREQLEHLIRASEAENVNISVLPIKSRRPIANTLFTLFTPRDEDDWEIVNEEGNISDQWFETPAQVNSFRAIWDDLRRRSVDGDKAREIIRGVLRSEYPNLKGDDDVSSPVRQE
jgi:transcriptional regulator with XRE-family HTH domain